MVALEMRCLTLLLILFTSGCETLHFYSQGASGQLEILTKSKPNKEIIASADSDESLRRKLILAEEICTFATRELALPGHSAYHRYADLKRDHVVFVLHAAPEFSLEPKTWNYLFVGELDYRGYFSETDAEAYADKLRSKENLEVHLGGTDAYSTLGVFHDPLLNTFIDYPEIDFAETIFHELTHRRIFVDDDTTFNESLANTVAEEGIRRWLKSRNRHDALADYEQRLIRRREFYDQIDITRAQLTKLYASDLPPVAMRKQKQHILGKLKTRARDLQKRWGGKPLEDWLKQDLTNAHLLALVTYNRDISKFKKLLEDSNGDFETFFRKVENLPENRS
ncbi:aminopeptidase [Luteolibacter sp. AS25]|uniref:aminopeptidase n=1 Tax=Luteolibacter sp. AS25 TaxID=3135776 RepID=UPI00398B6D94